jgi:hypothetical protein
MSSICSSNRAMTFLLERPSGLISIADVPIQIAL